MKTTILTCDVCQKWTDSKRIDGWWGLGQTLKGNLDLQVKILKKQEIDAHDRHVCSKECLAIAMVGFTKTVDEAKMVKHQQHVPPLEKSFSDYFSMFQSGFANGLIKPDTSDSVGYYKERKEEKEPTEDDVE